MALLHSVPTFVDVVGASHTTQHTHFACNDDAYSGRAMTMPFAAEHAALSPFTCSAQSFLQHSPTK